MIGLIFLSIVFLVSALFFYTRYSHLHSHYNLLLQNNINRNMLERAFQDELSYQEMLKNLKNQEFLVNFSNYLNTSAQFDHKINNALHILGKFIKIQRIIIFSDSDDSRKFQNTHEWNTTSKCITEEIKEELFYSDSLTAWKFQLIKDGFFITTGIEDLPAALGRYVFLPETTSVLILPMFHFNEFGGFIVFEARDHIKIWDDLEVGFIKNTALFLMTAFERCTSERSILTTIIQTEEKERGRLARDLHDGLGPLLSSMKLYVNVLGSSDTQKEEVFKSTYEVIDESIALIKEIANNLSPHVLNDFGLASAIQSFCKRISVTKAIEIKFDSNVYDCRFDTNMEMVLFRVLKELVNNTIRHALAKGIEIFLLRTGNMLTLVYSDNGIGFDIRKVLDDRTSGMGISNIIHRVGSINGKIVFENQSPKGIQLKIEVALK